MAARPWFAGCYFSYGVEICHLTKTILIAKISVKNTENPKDSMRLVAQVAHALIVEIIDYILIKSENSRPKIKSRTNNLIGW